MSDIEYYTIFVRVFNVILQISLGTLYFKWCVGFLKSIMAGEKNGMTLLLLLLFFATGHFLYTLAGNTILILLDKPDFIRVVWLAASTTTWLIIAAYIEVKYWDKP